MHDHQALVHQQFGSTARAYLDSAVHAGGQDLQRLTELLAAEGATRVLDVGCGGGHASFAAAAAGAEVWACDPADEMLAVVAEAAQARGHHRLQTRKGVAEALPFGDAAFDAVITRMSAHHWHDVTAALGEIRRVLRPGGLFLMIDVAGAESALCDTWLQTVELLRDPSHVRNHAPSVWAALLAAAGFASGPADLWRLPIAFDPWIARMRTPPVAVAAIRHLWALAPEEVRRSRALADDGSFELDVAMFVARAPAQAGAASL